MLGPMKFLAQKTLSLKKYWDKNIFHSKKVLSKKLDPKNLGPRKICQKITDKKNIAKKQDQRSQDKYCLNKCHQDSCVLLNLVPETFLKRLVTIGWVTDEVLLFEMVGGGWWWFAKSLLCQTNLGYVRLASVEVEGFDYFRSIQLGPVS